MSHARIARIEPGSIAEEIGVLPGDALVAVNGAPVTDYIAYRFATAGEVVTLEIARGDARAEVEIEKDADEDLGLVFEADVFDGVRRCANRCVFCFEEQMPAGMRPALTLRDDDFRLSFLHGNFLTLTNLRPEDEARILRERLSPLFVSVHATDPEVRRRMLGNRRAPDVLAQMDRLLAGGIELHAQIVLCPGWNDGDVLARTLDDLAARHPGVVSVGIVPVGLTAHRPEGPEVRAVTPADATAALAIVEARQAHNLAALGTRQVFAADEFYLMLGREVPPADVYEDFPQLENGIGLARRFLDALEDLEVPAHLPAGQATLATGTLAAPLLERLAARLRAAGADIQVVAVPNAFYGGGVSVAGLLTARDLRAALTGRDLGRLLILPAASLNADCVFLDDATPADLERALGVPLAFAHTPEQVVAMVASGSQPRSRRRLG